MHGSTRSPVSVARKYPVSKLTYLPLRAAVVLALAATAFGCEGAISDPEPFAAPGGDELGGPSIDGPVPSQKGSPSGGTAQPGGPNTPAGDPTAACTPQSAAPAPISRLTNLEYRNTVADLFDGVEIPDLALPADNIVEGFDNNAKSQTPAPALIEAYRASAEAVATAATADLDAVMPCTANATSEESACAQQWIEAFAPRVYRRPLSAEEKARIVAFFNNSRTVHGYQTAVSLVIQALLQTPQFLYRIEIGGAAKNGSARLTGHELASRLSYFFWDTMPDDALLAAAARGDLDTAAGVESQARRMLADPRTKAAVANFHRQWLRFDKMDAMQKSTGMYPNWNPQVAESLRASANKFVEHVFWQMEGSLESLLTDNGAFVNDDIAEIYGVAKPNSKNLVWRETDPARRSGILTQAGLLAGFAHETTDSPVLRGVFVMDRFFCAPPAPPPPGVTGAVSEITSSDAPMTTRDRFALTHESGTCATCHHAIDGFGFGFSHYDAVGGWRDTENGLPINAKGWISQTSDANGDFDGAVELGQRMAGSQQVNSCVTEQWFRYSLGLGADDLDACTIAQVNEAMAKNPDDMREILIAAVTSEAFRHRPEVTP